MLRVPPKVLIGAESSRCWCHLYGLNGKDVVQNEVQSPEDNAWFVKYFTSDITHLKLQKLLKVIASISP
jgi:hypothetical protein